MQKRQTARLKNFITHLLIKLQEPNKNHSIALKAFYQKSFKYSRIWSKF